MSGSPSAELDLPSLLAKLREQYGVSVSYAVLWRAVIEGRIPSRRAGRQYRVLEADAPAAARLLGLPPSAA